MILTDPPSYRCPFCGRVSFNENDLANSYCTCCGGVDLAWVKFCVHRPPLSGSYLLLEEDRQIVLLALAKLRAERPGWETALTRIAERLDGLSQYQEFWSLAYSEMEAGR